MGERATFIRSVFDLKDLPSDGIPQIALIGRSNVGKSSLINSLADQKNLAKTSSTPGKTLSLNFYKFGKFYLVDTPGYGYAQQGKADRAKWVKLMEGYVTSNELLKRIGIVIDARHEGLENDVNAMEWLDEMGLDWFTILTKSDKVTQRELSAHEKYLRTGFGEGKSLFSVSSQSGKGIRPLQSYLLSTFAAIAPTSSAT